jgi:hypothetical protein
MWLALNSADVTCPMSIGPQPYRCPNGTDRPFGPKPDTILTRYQPDPTRSPPCPGRAGPTAGPCMGRSLGTMYLAQPGPLKQAARRWPVKKMPRPQSHTAIPIRSIARSLPTPQSPGTHRSHSFFPTRRRSPNPNPLRFRFARRRWTSAVAVLHSSPVPLGHRPAHRW